MSYKGFSKEITKRIGLSPEAVVVNTFTATKYLRSGIHMVQGVEFASVYDLITGSRSYWREVSGKKSPVGWRCGRILL